MSKLFKNYLNNFSDITDYYKFLVSKTKNHEYVDITNEWLIDNYYVLVEHKNNIINSKKEIKKNIKVISKNYELLKNIAAKKNYNIDFKFLIDELKQYQKETKNTFTYKELKFVVPTLVFIYTERLNNLCRNEYSKVVDKEDVNKIINAKQNLTLNDFIPENFDLKNNSHYIFEVNNQLYRTKNNAELFKNLNEYLKNNEISLKDVINDEFQNKINNNVLISNIFNDFNDFFEFATEELFEKVNKTEKLLNTDPAYKNMTIESKMSYRNRLLKLARRAHCSEYEYLEKKFTPNKHIGFILFKNKSNTNKTVLYIASIVILTSIICVLLSGLFIKPRILGFIILFIPISQLVVQIINQFLTSVIPPKVMPKYDYSKGIPEKARTMVVIPTIISNKEKMSSL